VMMWMDQHEILSVLNACSIITIMVLTKIHSNLEKRFIKTLSPKFVAKMDILSEVPIKFAERVKEAAEKAGEDILDYTANHFSIKVVEQMLMQDGILVSSSLSNRKLASKVHEDTIKILTK